MAGIYIHIPFCKVKCHYCDFHFSTNHQRVNEMVNAMCQEIEQRKDYIERTPLQTIYFGGGTPSILPNPLFEQIVNQIKANFKIEPSAEFTVECNPDDINTERLSFYKSIGVNRLSIGIQSFEQDQLALLNRAHNAQEAKSAVQLAQSIGFSDITIDLIYGLPNTDETYWRNQVETAIALKVPHISSYCLTFEEKTVFANWLKKGKIKALPDEANLQQFQILTHLLTQAGYEHYEISNFARPGKIAKHNSAYWLGKPYLGIGPSAHSFNGHTRQWNIANNHQYITALNQNISYYELEKLSQADRFNEYILTRLRTKWGIDLADLSNRFPKETLSITPLLENFLNQGSLKQQQDTILLTDQGKFIADHIASELFIV